MPQLMVSHQILLELVAQVNINPIDAALVVTDRTKVSDELTEIRIIGIISVQERKNEMLLPAYLSNVFF